MNAVLEARGPSARYLDTVQPALVRQFELMATAPGGVARLRELILTLAVQGKLVPQDPSDEPASVLLAHVQARQRQLVAEGKIKANKPEAQFGACECPFDVPVGWEWICAADACVVVTDGDHQAPPRADSGVPFLVIGDVRDGVVDLDSATRFVPQDYFNALDWGKKPLRGDVLYTTVGSLGIPVPVVQQQHFCFQRHIALLRPGLPELQPFVTLALQSRLAFDQAETGATGIAQKTVPLSVLRRLRLPLPPASEQARIVARVDELMRLCDALEAKGRLEAEQHARLLGTLLGTLTDSTTSEELAANWQRVADHFDLLLDRPEAVDVLEQTILQLAVRGLLVPQDPSDEPASILLDKIIDDRQRLAADGKLSRRPEHSSPLESSTPFEIPQGWLWVRFGGYVHELCTGPFGSVIHKEDYVSGGVPLINPSHMIGGRIQCDLNVAVAPGMAEQLSAYQLSPGDVLMARRGEVGRYALVTEEEAGWLCGTGSFFVKLAEFCNRDFFGLMLEDPRFRAYLLGESVGATMTNLNQRILLHAPLAIPPLAEQARIVARVTELRRLCADLRQRLAASQAIQSHLAEALVQATIA